MSKPSPDQFDFFREPVFQTRMAKTQIDPDRFRAILKRAMAKAIRETPYSRDEVALRMAAYLGKHVSKGTLDAYTAESKPGHIIGILPFKAFVFATGANWLFDMLVADEGLTVLDGDEARLAEIGRLQQDQKDIAAQLKALRAKPVRVRERAK